MDKSEARGLLNEERERLDQQIRRAEAEAVRDPSEIDPSDREQLGADAASNLYDREMAATTLSYLREQLAEVDAAFERLDKGTYGISEVSGKPIPDERLRVRPTARYLADEQQQFERGVRTNG